MARKYKNVLTFAIDFDGTLAEHTFPAIGKEIPMAAQTCRELLAKGYKLFLNTVRSDEYLEAAKQWCLERGLNFNGWNKNPEQITTSPKVQADIYIDDAALGCPLVFTRKGTRPYVDWNVVRKALIDNGIL